MEGEGQGTGVEALLLKMERMREEILAGLAYTGNPLNRLSYERKDTKYLESLLAHDSSVCLPFHGLFPLLQKSASGKEPKWLKLSQMEAIVGPSLKEGLIMLGTKDEIAYYASVVQDPAPFIDGDDCQFADLRRTIMLLSSPDAAIAGQARALVEWHGSHVYCGTCGSKTEPTEGGAKRICTNVAVPEGEEPKEAATGDKKQGCGLKSYPQTTPAVIMLVLSPDGKKCLLGRQKIWPTGMWSTLAGFVDTQETPEEAVRREVMEEAGVEVGKVTYFGSQPWPFGGQLMIGFFAVAKNETIKVDQNELEAAEWYTPEQVSQGLELSKSSPSSFFTLKEWRVPPPTAIANRLCAAWVTACKL